MEGAQDFVPLGRRPREFSDRHIQCARFRGSIGKTEFKDIVYIIDTNLKVCIP